MSDTIAYPSLSDFPTTGNSYTEYYTLDTAKTYRWNSDTSSYSEVSTSVNIGTLPLPTGASSESTLLSVLQAVQNNRAYQETIFTDNNAGTLTFFIRRTVANPTTGLPETSYLLPDGTPYTPTGTIQVATANKDNELRSITYQANTTNGVHYTSGDYILRTDIFDITSNPASLLSAIWLNITTNNVIGITPTASHLTFVTSGADLTTTNTKLDTLHTDLTTTNTNTGTTATNTGNVDTNLGAKADASASTDTGSFSLISLVKRGLSSLTSLSAKFGVLGQTTMAGSAPVVIASNQSNLPNNIAAINGTLVAYGTDKRSGTNVLASYPLGFFNYSTATTAVNVNGTTILTTFSNSLAEGTTSNYQVTLSVLSGGSSPTFDCKLQRSMDNQSTYVDVYHFPRMTTLNDSFYIPSFLCDAETRLVCVTAGSPTTASITWHKSNNSGVTPKQRQFFDRTSSLLAGTVGAGTTYNISGCKIVNAAMLASAVVSGGTYQLEVSSDGTNFYKVGTAKQLTTANELLQLDGLTNNTYQYARINCTVGVVTSQTGVYGLITGSN